MIRPDGNGALVELIGDSPARMLRWLTEIIGGHVTAYGIGDWLAYTIADELRGGELFNPQADAMARVLGYPFDLGDYLVGSVVFFGRSDGDPTETDVPQHVLDLARAAGIAVAA